MSSDNTCTRSPGCTFPDGHSSGHPCGKQIIPGDPCEYCGKPTSLDGEPCWDCWSPVNAADLKAIFAEAGYDTIITPVPAGDAR